MLWQPSNTSEDVLMHYAKGSRAKKHKYIAIKNGRYIYPEDKTDAYKKAQKAASEHAPHFEGKAGEYVYTYKYRTNSPGTSGNELHVPYGTRNSANEDVDYIKGVKRRGVENPSHMRSDVERSDYFAGAAAKYDSTKKRMAIAKSLARDAEESQLGQLAKKKPAYYSNPDQKKWETVAKSAGYRQKQKEELAAKKQKIKDAAQEAGKNRTEYEKNKANKETERRENAAFESAAREQEKGRNRTAQNVKLLKGSAGFSKTAAKLRQQGKIASGGKTFKNENAKSYLLKEYRQSETAQSQKYYKKADQADKIFRTAQTAANNDRRNTGSYGGMASSNSKKGKKPINKTARKNQRRAKIEFAAFKAKRITKKAVSKGKLIFSKFIKN